MLHGISTNSPAISTIFYCIILYFVLDIWRHLQITIRNDNKKNYNKKPLGFSDLAGELGNWAQALALALAPWTPIAENIALAVQYSAV